MISESDADTALQLVAKELLATPYEELKSLGNQIARGLVDGIRDIPTPSGNARVAIMITPSGIFRKRACVELVLESDDKSQKQPVSGLYFEKYRSGRIYSAPTRRRT